MMRQVMFAAVAAMALAACNQNGSGPALPPVQAGAQAPSTQTPAQATRQANITDEVRQQLISNIGAQLQQFQTQFAAGYTPPQGMGDIIQAMQPGTDHRWTLNMTANTSYVIVGACDGDCTNVDIELIDMTTGGVVASDMLPDDYPVVNFTPTADGQYMARLLLQNCTTAPCYAGARVVSSAAGAPK
jgi:hypothetical protein